MFTRINNFIKTYKRYLFYILVGLQILFLLGMAGTRLFPLWFGKKILLKPLPVDPNDFFRGEYVRFAYELSTVSVEEAMTNDEIKVILKKDGRFWKAVRALKKGEGISSSDPDTLFIKGRVKDIYEYRVLVLTDFKDVSNPGWVTEHPDETGNLGRFICSSSLDFKKDETLYIALKFNSRTNDWEADREYLSNEPFTLDDTFLSEDAVIVSARVKDITTGYDVDVEYGIESWFVPEGEALNYENELFDRMAVEIAVDSGGNAVISRVFVDDKPVSY
ncbi:MAG: GDYXXLXY domain-containing protein [Spirochaetales bacterium]|nr:GDYXXLXY domain-containing protein [Spirochaetales bacterium]